MGALTSATTVWVAALALLGPMQIAAESAGRQGNATGIPGPQVHHILIEVKNIKTSLAFYHDCLGLAVLSDTAGFATLESGGAGIYLWQNSWSWEKPHGGCNGAGMYPHFEVSDVRAAVDRFRAAGYDIVQSPRTYDWGTEAFVRDPDGYIIALVNMTR